MVMVKNWPYFHLFNIGKIAQQNAVFESILERTKACPDHKNNKLKQSKKLGFFQRFWLKIGNFSIIGEIGQEKCV